VTVIVFIVWIITNNLARFVRESNRLAPRLGGARRAERAAGII
jgi:hypothetical protein